MRVSFDLSRAPSDVDEEKKELRNCKMKKKKEKNKKKNEEKKPHLSYFVFGVCHCRSFRDDVAQRCIDAVNKVSLFKGAL